MNQHLSCGNDFPDKTFYLITFENGGSGLFSMVHCVLAHIVHAVEHGMVPVVDLPQGSCIYFDAQKGPNAWEYFFEQPCGIGMEDVRHAKNVAVAREREIPELNRLKAFGHGADRAFLEKNWKKYIRLNAATKKICNHSAAFSIIS